jgi:serine protease DegS
MDADLRLVHRAVPSVVHIHAHVPESHVSSGNLGRERMGAGAIVDSQGYILTVNYVILGASSIAVTLSNGTSYQARLVCQDYESGLGVIQIDAADLPALPMVSSQSLSLGQPLFIVTSVDETERRVNDGAVTSLGPFDAFWEYMIERSITLTCFNPGYGGGPVIDSAGRMVGVVSLNLNEVGRFSFAIPVEFYLDNREEIARLGSIKRPLKAWLGYYPHPSPDGVQIAGVVPNGPAETCGLTEGDLILAVNQKKIETRKELYREMWKKRPGDTLVLRVLRGGVVKTVEVIAGDRDEFYK